MERDGVKTCPECGFSASDQHQFCRRCGFKFPLVSFGEERNLRAAIPEKGLGPWIDSAVKIFVVIALLGILAALIPTQGRPRTASREKACYANMRVLLGAIEMYNMDSAVMQKTMNEPFIRRLTNENYLKGGLSRPESGCRYTSSGDLTATGKILCDVHGTVGRD